MTQSSFATCKIIRYVISLSFLVLAPLVQGVCHCFLSFHGHFMARFSRNNISHCIHGTCIFTYMNGCFFLVNVGTYTVYHTWILWVWKIGCGHKMALVYKVNVALVKLTVNHAGKLWVDLFGNEVKVSSVLWLIWWILLVFYIDCVIVDIVIIILLSLLFFLKQYHHYY